MSDDVFSYAKHERKQHKAIQKLVSVIYPIKSGYEVRLEKQFMNQTHEYVIKMKQKQTDYVHALEDVRIPLMKLFWNKLEEGPITAKVVLVINMTRLDGKKEDVYLHSNENTSRVQIFNKRQVNSSINTMYKVLENAIDRFTENGSQWIFNFPIRLEIHIAKYLNLQGGKHVPAPEWLVNKKGYVNILNNNEYCIDYCVAAFFNRKDKNEERVKQYEEWIAKNIKRNGIIYPLAVEKIYKYCEVNSHLEISIDVYKIGNEDKSIQIEYLTRPTIKKNHISLILYKDHYMLIKSMSKFRGNRDSKTKKLHHYCTKCLLSFTANDSMLKHKEKCQARIDEVYTKTSNYCNSCCNTMDSEEHLKQHIEDCYQFDPMPVEMPTDNIRFEYYDQRKQQMIRYVCYADFETMLIKVEDMDNIKYIHVPASFRLILIDSKYDKVINKKMYLGKDCMYKFFEALDEIREYVLQQYKENVKMKKLTVDEQREYDKATKCWICDGEFTKENKKVRDHDHMTGKFRNAAHWKCNIFYNFKKMKIPCIIHNFKGFDSHLIINAYGKYQNERYEIDRFHKIKCIATTMEKYMNITMMSFTFLDSLQFIKASLSKLVSTLKKDFGTQHFRYTKEEFGDDKIDLMSGKLPYAYTFATSFEDYNKEIFPPQEAYDDDLVKDPDNKNDTTGKCSEEDYEKVLKVRKTFNCKTYKDEHDVYLKLDVTLLADVFEFFRKRCHSQFQLDPCWFVSLPGYSWMSMLKKLSLKSKEIEIISDQDMYMMFEKGSRGGICIGNMRYLKKEKNKHILYIDANNLYGYAMIQYLPDGNYRWLTKKK